MASKGFGNLVGVLMGLVTAGAILYMVGVRCQLWHSPPGGFWTF
jgi:hypothetical protein